ncbi:MAG: chitobiase/beta-hexosaminidase C-terminal domain-containing protein [Bacteroidales bacterium]|nr:chitobiase/beta-hexosaminidase C-terminal domain-containing protein [Bacteroidales bacterium]
MKRKITILLAAMLLMSGLSWAQTTINWTASEQGYQNAQEITSASFDDNVSGTFAKGTNSNAPKYYNTGAAIRCYGGNYFTITSNYVLTEIVIGFGSGDGSNAITTSVGSYENGTWTGDANEVTFTIGGTSGNRRIASFAITYSTGGAPNCATPTFSPAAGIYVEAQSVAISCTTENATVYYTLDGNEPTNESSVYSEPLNITETTTVKAMAVADGYNNSSVASATYTFVTIVHEGTEEDPYTVADAHAAIDANDGTTEGVYATGIVSEIVTPWGYNDYQNITFDIVDEEGDEVYLRAYRCEGDEAANVAVGDVVVVSGDLTKYGAIYEFAQGCQVVSLEHPAVVVEAPIFSPEAGTYDEAQTVAISTATEGADIYYTLDGTEPTMNSTMYENPLQISETTTIKAIAVDGDDNASTVATATYHICSANSPYTVTQALNFIEYPTSTIWVHGIVSTAPTSAPNSNGQLTYYISDDGTANDQLQVYKGLGLNNEAFTLIDDIQVGDIVTITGIVKIYNNTKEFDAGNYLVSFERPQSTVPSITVEPDAVSVDANEHDGTLNLAYENLTITDMTDFDIQYYDAQGQELNGDDVPGWIEVSVAEQDPQIGEGYVVSYYMMENEGEARTAYFKVYAMDDETNLVYSNPVTITQEAYVAPATEDWVLTDLADLMEGDIFVIVGTRTDNNAGNYAMPNDKGTSAPNAVAITVNDNALAAAPADNLKWNISVTADGYIFYPNGSTATWLYCTNTNNGVKVGVGDARHFTLSDNGYLTTIETSDQRYLGLYNAQDWRCYTSEGGNIANQTFAFYKKVVEPETYTLYITGYGENEGGYNLIASPVYVKPETTGMTEGDFDLYWFDQTQELEWRNYEEAAFNLIPGKGYLYANTTDVELTFTGTPYSGDGSVSLVKDNNAVWSGWNLVGNPFGETAYIDRDFYVMNEAGTEILTDACTGAVEAMQGVFVIAEGDDETLTFSTEAPAAAANVTLNLTQSRGTVIDRAIVRFGEGRQLPKFQLNAESTKLYIPQGNNDYAVVRSGAQGEMPVNFKASKNGSYTIAIDAKNVEVSYLHLIDNMTGADVDLLASPSYSFEANTTDHASRFRLVFSANNVNDNTTSETFAFFNGSEWSISNTGRATLQVVDVLGRIVSSESINGNTTLSTTNLKDGVYMFRLVNGENVKVQKVVVK